MKLGRKARIGAVVLTLLSPAVLGFFTPSRAGTPSTSALIDKDFEIALRKFVSKRFFNRIDASAAQRDKLSKIMSETADATRSQREELKQGMLDLSGMVADDKTSDEQIRTKVNELRAIQQKVQDTRITAVLEARKVLTAEQRQQINQRITELLSGGFQPRRIGMFLQSGSNSILGD